MYPPSPASKEISQYVKNTEGNLMVNQSAHSVRCVLDLKKVVSVNKRSQKCPPARRHRAPCGTPRDGGRADIFATFGACGASHGFTLVKSEPEPVLPNLC